MSVAEQRQRNRGRYRSVLRCVDHHTGLPSTPKPAVYPPRNVVLNLGVHGRYEPRGVWQSIRAALQQEDLLLLEGQQRRGVARATARAMKAVIAHQNVSEDPDVQLREQALKALGVQQR